jgi:hypothetical protein
MTTQSEEMGHPAPELGQEPVAYLVTTKRHNKLDAKLVYKLDDLVLDEATKVVSYEPLYAAQQTKHDARQATWVAFDINDKTTWPPNLPERYILRVMVGGGYLILDAACGFIHGELLFGRQGKQYEFDGLVTHWMQPPSF